MSLLKTKPMKGKANKKKNVMYIVHIKTCNMHIMCNVNQRYKKKKQRKKIDKKN